MKNLFLTTLSFCFLLLIGCQTQELELPQNEELIAPQELIDYKTFLETSLGDDYFLAEELEMISIINNISLEELQETTSKEKFAEYLTMAEKFIEHEYTLETEGFQSFIEALQLSSEDQNQMYSIMNKFSQWENNYNYHYNLAASSIEKIERDIVVAPYEYYRFFNIKNNVQVRSCDDNPPPIDCYLANGATLPIDKEVSNDNNCFNQRTQCFSAASQEAEDCFEFCLENGSSLSLEDPCIEACDNIEEQRRIICSFIYQVCIEGI